MRSPTPRTSPRRSGRQGRGVLAAAGVLALAAAAGLATATPAAASDTPGSYTHYGFPSGTAGLSDVTFRTTVTKDAGPASNIFWSHQFGFTAGNGAYTGMQSNGPGQTRTFLFSVWDATEAKTGSTGSYCLDFGGEGVGKSCRLKTDWKEGDTFRTRVAHEGDRWFGVTVTNETTGASFKLGSIRAGSTQISPSGMVDWAEYFEWNNPKASCDDQPYSQARFGVPVANGGAVTASVSSTQVSSSCAAYSRVDTVSGGSVQTNGIGNSVRGPVTGLGGKVLAGAQNTSGSPAIVTGPTGAAEQAWVLGKDGALHLMGQGLCLDVQGGAQANGTPAIVWSCTGGTNQQWRAENGSLRNPASGRCLDIPGSNTTNGTQVIIWDCQGTSNQKWTVPVVP
ncbi:ricin-type beta-trefoil lectin domain protein [Streptomyces xanthii]|uniref:RICIN domain-containing protein n=1 Tax=Streptomyces xanthii TaxID=2768069 RepID=A0A7H1BH52_9ACTN|nr:ricin-type beta-trefoil lectin domain protein [Streptomyces xanthii]QNS08057.1 RICIN domain-containing protein [Streptomyces xanthii]